MLYVDASALVKLVVREVESDALRRYIGAHDSLASSGLVYTETVRAVARNGDDQVSLARRLLGRITLIELDAATLQSAAQLGPPSLRTLDAIHIATALMLGDELDALVTYDRRMQDAAVALGMDVAAPV